MITNPIHTKSAKARLSLLYQKPIAQVSTALILSLFATAFFGIVAVRPTLTTVAELRQELDQKRDLYQKVTTKLTTLNQIEDEYTQNSGLLSIFDTIVPSDHNLNQLLLQIEYLAYQQNLNLNSLRSDAVTIHGDPLPQKKTTAYKDALPFDPSYQYTRLSLSALGTYNQLSQFLSSIQNLDRIIYIESASLVRNNDEEVIAEARLNTTFYIFWQPN